MVIVDAVLNMDAVLHVVCCVETDSRVFQTDDQWPQSMTHSHPETSSLRSHTHTQTQPHTRTHTHTLMHACTHTLTRRGTFRGIVTNLLTHIKTQIHTHPVSFSC